MGNRWRLLRVTPQLAAIGLAGAGAWLVVVGLVKGLGAMPGTMGLQLPAFTGVWTAMMAAMMLPSVAPVAAMYSRTITERRIQRLLLFTAGYLLVWSGIAPLFYVLAACVSVVAQGHPILASVTAAAVFIGTGAYQLSPLKEVCLKHCRSPIAHLFTYLSFGGPLRDFRVGLHHAGYCLGCCWALMLVLVATGLMNLFAMVVLAMVVLIEKHFTSGAWFSRTVAIAAIGIGLATHWLPQLAPGMVTSM